MPNQDDEGNLDPEERAILRNFFSDRRDTSEPFPRRAILTPRPAFFDRPQYQTTKYKVGVPTAEFIEYLFPQSPDGVQEIVKTFEGLEDSLGLKTTRGVLGLEERMAYARFSRLTRENNSHRLKHDLQDAKNIKDIFEIIMTPDAKKWMDELRFYFSIHTAFLTAEPSLTCQTEITVDKSKAESNHPDEAVSNGNHAALLSPFFPNTLSDRLDYSSASFKQFLFDLNGPVRQYGGQVEQRTKHGLTPIKYKGRALDRIPKSDEERIRLYALLVSDRIHMSWQDIPARMEAHLGRYMPDPSIALVH